MSDTPGGKPHQALNACIEQSCVRGPPLLKASRKPNEGFFFDETILEAWLLRSWFSFPGTQLSLSFDALLLEQKQPNNHGLLARWHLEEVKWSVRSQERAHVQSRASSGSTSRHQGSGVSGWTLCAGDQSAEFLWSEDPLLTAPWGHMQDPGIVCTLVTD